MQTNRYLVSKSRVMRWEMVGKVKNLKQNIDNSLMAFINENRDVYEENLREKIKAELLNPTEEAGIVSFENIKYLLKCINVMCVGKTTVNKSIVESPVKNTAYTSISSYIKNLNEFNNMVGDDKKVNISDLSSGHLVVDANTTTKSLQKTVSEMVGLGRGMLTQSYNFDSEEIKDEINAILEETNIEAKTDLVAKLVMAYRDVNAVWEKGCNAYNNSLSETLPSIKVLKDTYKKCEKVINDETFTFNEFVENYSGYVNVLNNVAKVVEVKEGQVSLKKDKLAEEKTVYRQGEKLSVEENTTELNSLTKRKKDLNKQRNELQIAKSTLESSKGLILGDLENCEEFVAEQVEKVGGEISSIDVIMNTFANKQNILNNKDIDLVTATRLFTGEQMEKYVGYVNKFVEAKESYNALVSDSNMQEINKMAQNGSKFIIVDEMLQNDESLNKRIEALNTQIDVNNRQSLYNKVFGKETDVNSGMLNNIEHMQALLNSVLNPEADLDGIDHNFNESLTLYNAHLTDAKRSKNNYETTREELLKKNKETIKQLDKNVDVLSKRSVVKTISKTQELRDLYNSIATYQSESERFEAESSKKFFALTSEIILEKNLTRNALENEKKLVAEYKNTKFGHVNNLESDYSKTREKLAADHNGEIPSEISTALYFLRDEITRANNPTEVKENFDKVLDSLMAEKEDGVKKLEDLAEKQRLIGGLTNQIVKIAEDRKEIEKAALNEFKATSNGVLLLTEGEWNNSKNQLVTKIAGLVTEYPEEVAEEEIEGQQKLKYPPMIVKKDVVKTDETKDDEISTSTAIVTKDFFNYSLYKPQDEEKDEDKDDIIDLTEDDYTTVGDETDDEDLDKGNDNDTDNDTEEKGTSLIVPGKEEETKENKTSGNIYNIYLDIKGNGHDYSGDLDKINKTLEDQNKQIEELNKKLAEQNKIIEGYGKEKNDILNAIASRMEGFKNNQNVDLTELNSALSTLASILKENFEETNKQRAEENKLLSDKLDLIADILKGKSSKEDKTDDKTDEIDDEKNKGKKTPKKEDKEDKKDKTDGTDTEDGGEDEDKDKDTPIEKEVVLPGRPYGMTGYLLTDDNQLISDTGKCDIEEWIKKNPDKCGQVKSIIVDKGSVVRPGVLSNFANAEKVKLNRGVLGVGENAFAGMPQLKSVYVNDDVKKDKNGMSVMAIHEDAFNGVSGKTDVRYATNGPESKFYSKSSPKEFMDYYNGTLLKKDIKPEEEKNKKKKKQEVEEEIKKTKKQVRKSNRLALLPKSKTGSFFHWIARKPVLSAFMLTSVGLLGYMGITSAFFPAAFTALTGVLSTVGGSVAVIAGATMLISSGIKQVAKLFSKRYRQMFNDAKIEKLSRKAIRKMRSGENYMAMAHEQKTAELHAYEEMLAGERSFGGTKAILKRRDGYYRKAIKKGKKRYKATDKLIKKLDKIAEKREVLQSQLAFKKKNDTLRSEDTLQDVKGYLSAIKEERGNAEMLQELIEGRKKGAKKDKKAEKENLLDGSVYATFIANKKTQEKQAENVVKGTEMFDAIPDLETTEKPEVVTMTNRIKFGLEQLQEKVDKLDVKEEPKIEVDDIHVDMGK